MFADDKSIENFQQLFFEFKKYLELHQIRVNGKTDYPVFNVNHGISTYHLRHGSPVLPAFCSGLCIRTIGRRPHGKFCHYSRHQRSAHRSCYYFPQATHHISYGELPCQFIFN